MQTLTRTFSNNRSKDLSIFENSKSKCSSTKTKLGPSTLHYKPSRQWIMECERDETDPTTSHWRKQVLINKARKHTFDFSNTIKSTVFARKSEKDHEANPQNLWDMNSWINFRWTQSTTSHGGKEAQTTIQVKRSSIFELQVKILFATKLMISHDKQFGWSKYYDFEFWKNWTMRNAAVKSIQSTAWTNFCSINAWLPQKLIVMYD